MINWPLIKTWENWLIIPIMAFFFFFLAAILADFIPDTIEG